METKKRRQNRDGRSTSKRKKADEISHKKEGEPRIVLDVMIDALTEMYFNGFGHLPR